MSELETQHISEPSQSQDGLDDLLSGIYENAGRSSNFEMHGESQSQPTNAATQEQTPKEWEIDWNGKKIKADETKLRQWASQGYDYSQKMAQLNQSQKQKEQEFARKMREHEQKFAPYMQIDEAARKNPQWWNHVVQGWQQFQQQPMQNVPTELKNYLDPVVKDYGLVKEFIQDYQRAQVEQNIKTQDTQLDGDIQSLRGQYAQLDWNAKDETGQTLEQRVLNFALQNQLPTFKMAFQLYNQDLFMKQAEARGREAIQKEQEKRKKSGLLSQSSTPTKPSFNIPSPKGSTKNRSYADLHKDILRELNIA